MRASLARAWSSTDPCASPVSAAKPTTTWAAPVRVAAGDELGEDVGGALERDRASGTPPASSFLILWPALSTGRKSATAAAMTTTSASEACSRTACRRSSADTTRTTVAPTGSGERDVGRHEDHVGTALGRRGGEGVALLAAAAVPEEADRVEVLARAARAHEHGATREVGRRATALEDLAADLVDRLGVGQAPGTGVGAGEAPDRRVEHDHAAGAQGGDVGLRGRVLPHLGVHRRSHHDRAARGEQHVGEQVVGEPRRGTREEVGRGRRDDHEVGLLPEAHVRHVVDVVPHLGGDRLARQRGPGGRADEVQGGPGGDDGDVVAGLGEPAQQLGRLVRGDPAAHAEHHAGVVGAARRGHATGVPATAASASGS